MEMPRVIIYDHSGDFVCELSQNDVFSLIRTEEINGQNSLEITCTARLKQEQRVLVRDLMGIWREYVVIGVDESHLLYTYYCEWSLKHDLQGIVVEDKRPGSVSPVKASVALSALLSNTGRWDVGEVTQTTTGGITLYWISAWEGLGKIVDEWGGEVRADISVSLTGVVSRRLSLLSAVGDQTGKRRFDYGSDLTGIRRRIDEEPLYCRIYPRGKGEETDSDGFGRRITIESVNGGVAYLENGETAQAIRIPNGSGSYEYPSLVVVNDQMETASDLKAWGESVLGDYTTPRVTYESTVEQFAAAGMDPKGVSLGDAVQCVDRSFAPDAALRVNGRIVKIVQDERDPFGAELTLGRIASGMTSMIGGINSVVSEVARAVESMNGGTLSTADYLSRLLSRLNAEINATGGYTYITEGQGLRTYDKAVSDPLVGAEASGVVELKGGTIRIANSKTAQGEWEWKSVFTSGHVAAEVVTAANLKAGRIQSADGSSYWDLTGGEMVTNGMKANDIAATGNLSSSAARSRVDVTGGLLRFSYREAASAAWQDAGSLENFIISSAYYDGSAWLQERLPAFRLLSRNGLVRLSIHDSAFSFGASRYVDSTGSAMSLVTGIEGDSRGNLVLTAENEIRVTGPMNFNGTHSTMRYCAIDPDTGGAAGGITGTIALRHSNGSTYNLTFKNGFLVGTSV